MPSEQITATLLLGGVEFDGRVLVVRGTEGLSIPSRFEIDVLARDLDIAALRNELAVVIIADLHGNERRVSGRIAEVGISVIPADRALEWAPARLTLVPDLFLTMSMRVNHRIFQDLTTPEIVQKLFAETGLDTACWGTSLTGSYPKRVYTVQYGESDWAFASRLLEEEGIFYYVDHTDGCAAVVLCDDSSKVPKFETPLTFTWHPEQTGHQVHVWNWRETGKLGPSKVVLNDYDRLRPKLDLLAEEEVAQRPPREWYEYPGGYTDPAVGARLARVRLGELQSQRAVALAHTSAIFVQAGRIFTIEGHPRADGDHLIRSVSYHLRLEEVRDPAPFMEAGRIGLEIALETSPADVLFRPPRVTPRPRIHGIQSARVTGPPGQELHCNEHGHIKLQFPWDREGQLDDKSSRWIPVTQAHTTGSVMIPRVGWEVLVQYQDGDPDRPVCLGRVWNPFNTPPSNLPTDKTQTMHSTKSSPGGGGVNSVKLEDAANNEQIQIEAHKDLAVAVGNNKVYKVGHNLSHQVYGNRTVEITGNESIAVEANHDTKVGGSQTVTAGLRDVTVNGTAKEEIVADLSLTVGGAEMMKVGNPIQAVLDVIADAAVSAAAGVAASAAARAQGALLAPLQPALNAARSALGPAMAAAGPAAGLLAPAGGGALPPEFQQGVAALSATAATLDAASQASSFAEAAATGAFAGLGVGSASHAPALAPDEQGAAAGPGAQGAAADAAAQGAIAASSGGTGTWATVVTGNVTETVGGLMVINTAKGITLGIGANSNETVGAARIETVAGGLVETTGGSKAETVAVYKVDAKQSLSISSGAAVAINIAGSQKQTIKGSHSISSDGPVMVTAPQLKMKGSGAISLVCGANKVIIDSSGVAIKGGGKLEIEGSTIKLPEGFLGTVAVPAMAGPGSGGGGRQRRGRRGRQRQRAAVAAVAVARAAGAAAAAVAGAGRARAARQGPPRSTPARVAIRSTWFRATSSIARPTSSYRGRSRSCSSASIRRRATPTRTRRWGPGGRTASSSSSPRARTRCSCARVRAA